VAEELAHPFSRAYVLTWLAIIYHHRRTPQEAQTWVDTAVTFATAQGFPFWSTQGTVLQGWLLTEQGRMEEGIQLLRQGLADMQAIGTEVLQTYALSLLAEAYGKIHQPGDGLAMLDAAIRQVNASGERWPEAELHRLKGELLWQEDPQQRAPEAEASLLHALHVARHQQARLPELRAAMSLSRLWRTQGKASEAHRLLAEIYAWFTEGFDTPDLQEARALLEVLQKCMPDKNGHKTVDTVR
jgi:predicted ATPase